MHQSILVRKEGDGITIAIVKATAPLNMLEAAVGAGVAVAVEAEAGRLIMAHHRVAPLSWKEYR